jgi:hypothetical protein
MQNLGSRLDAPNNMWVRLGEFREAPNIQVKIYDYVKNFDVACQNFYVTHTCVISVKLHSFQEKYDTK